MSVTVTQTHTLARCEMDCEICFRFDVGDVRGVSSQHVLEVLHDVYISQAILLVVVSKGIYMVPHRRLLTL